MSLDYSSNKVSTFTLLHEKETHLVTVDLSLVWSLRGDTEVISLLGGEGGELDVQVVQVKTSDLLIQDLWKDVDTDVELARLAELNVLLGELWVLGLEEEDLSKNLVGERARHDERGVTGGTAQVDETALSEEDDVTAVGETEAVDLWLDDNVLDGVGLEPGNVNLAVEVTNVANDGIVWHLLEVWAHENVSAAGGGDEDLSTGSSILHGGNLETGDGGLESVDRINLSDNDTGTHSVESHGATLSDITETGDDGDLSGNHDIGGTLDTIDEGLTASVQVVELGLGDRVVDVDGWDKKSSLLQHSVQVVDTSGGLLRDTVAVLEELWVLLVDEGSKISSIVENQVELSSILEGVELLLEAPLVLLLGLSFPGEAVMIC